jgi:hypothetical protein
VSFNRGFNKTAGLTSTVAGKVMGALKTVGRGATRISSGNLSKPLSLGDKASAALTVSSAMSDYGDTAAKMRNAQMR